MWIHAEDAAARGIVDGQLVRVFNDRGATILPAHVTDRIARGVAAMKEGVWFTPNEEGTDLRGLSQRVDRGLLLARGGEHLQHLSLVEIGRAPRPR